MTHDTKLAKSRTDSIDSLECLKNPMKNLSLRKPEKTNMHCFMWFSKQTVT